MGSTANALARAKKALEDANNFTKSTGDPGMFKPKPEVKPQPERPDYQHARAARRFESAIPGGNENISSEINARQEMGKSVQ